MSDFDASDKAGEFLPFTWESRLADSKLSTHAKCVGFVLRHYCNARGFGAFPEIETLAEKASCSVRATQYAMRNLEAAKFIGWELRGLARRKWSARQYWLRLPEGEFDVPRSKSEVHHVHPTEVHQVHLSRRTDQRRNLKPSPNPISAEMGDWFEKLFEAYPNKQAKDRAWRKVQHMAPDAALRDEIAEGLARWRRYADLKSAPFLSTWLRNGTWREARTKRIPGLCSACGNVAVVGDGRDYWCGAHDPDRRPA